MVHFSFGPVTSMTLGSNVLDINRVYDERCLLMQNQAGTILNHVYTRDEEGKVLFNSGVNDVVPQPGATG